MKIQAIYLTFVLSGLSLFSTELHAQYNTKVTQTDQEVSDSLKSAHHQEELISAQKAVNADRMTDAKAREKQTKAIAKETRRIDREASAAAREAKMAYRSERKAQKARKDADKQARKAVKAKDISDKN